MYESWSESEAKYFFLRRVYGCDVEISLRCSLKFALQKRFLFMCSSGEKNVNYASKMAHMLLLSTCEEQGREGLVLFLWGEGHNPSEIHRELYGVYGEDCMDRSNVSGWCAFSKAAIPWGCAPPVVVATVCKVFPTHDTHVPGNFTRVIPFSPQKSHYFSLLFTHWRQ